MVIKAPVKKKRPQRTSRSKHVSAAGNPSNCSEPAGISSATTAPAPSQTTSPLESKQPEGISPAPSTPPPPEPKVKVTQEQKAAWDENIVYLPVFAEHVLGLKDLYPWQKKIFADIDTRWSRVAAVVCNGSGKTSRIGAGAAIWNLLVNVGSTTVVTSAVYRQVREQFMPSVRRMIRSMGMNGSGIVVNQNDVTVPETGSRLIAFTASDAGLFEGFHRTGISDSLLIIVDEAKSVSEDIFQAIERCQPDRLLLISSAGAPRGALWRAFAKEKEFWKLHRVTASQCPHIDPKWVEFQIAKWGREHPLVRSMIFSEWQSDEGESLVIDVAALDKLIDQPPHHATGERHAGLDFAAGGDENVIAIREGNKLTHLISWRDHDTMRAAARFVAELTSRGIRGDEVFADAGGIGRPIIDAMRMVGFSVHEVNFGSRPSYVDAYLNRATEMWYHMKGLVERRQIILGEDEELRQQLLLRRWTTTQNGKIRLESKEELRARGGSSPDRADAVVLAFSCFGLDKSLMTPTVYQRPPIGDILEATIMGELDTESLGIHAES